MSLDLNVVAKGETEQGRALTVGDVVQYKAHLPGGMVKIQHKDGGEDIAHPLCFAELR